MRAGIGLILAALAGACATPVAPPPALAPIAADAPFRDEILRFAEIDRATPPPACPILFVGSSSIRMWETLAADMAPWPVLNRGFGGSTIAQVNDYFDRVVAPYSPRAIVLYAGENGLDAGQSPAAVAEHFQRFLDAKRARFGSLPLFYISAKPSKARIAQLPAQSDLNARIRAISSGARDLTFIDVVPAMTEDGKPRDIFVADGLHMSPAGYAIWRDIVRRALVERGIDRATCR